MYLKLKYYLLMFCQKNNILAITLECGIKTKINGIYFYFCVLQSIIMAYDIFTTQKSKEKLLESVRTVRLYLRRLYNVHSRIDKFFMQMIITSKLLFKTLNYFLCTF